MWAGPSTARITSSAEDVVRPRWVPSAAPISGATVQTFAGLGGFVSLDWYLKRVFAQMDWTFPPALGGMFLILGVLAAVEAVGGEAALGKVYSALSPALAWLARWLPLFFVPTLVTLPRVTASLPGSELLAFSFVVVAGMVSSLIVTALVATSIRNLLKTPVQEVKSAGAAPPFTREHTQGWAAVAAAAALTSAVLPEYRYQATVAFMLATTVLGYLFGTGLPASVRKVLHPVITCGACGAAGVAVWSAAHGISFDSGLRTYLTKGAGLMGAGDILMGFLGAVILSFSFRIYEQRELMKRHFLEIFGTVTCSSLFSLFATALAARAVGLSPFLARSLLSRSVTVALALPMASMLDASLPLTAASVCVTGILGANFAQSILNALKFRDPITRGLATAGAAHGLGTAALAANEPAALPFCALAYALVGIASNLLVSMPAVRGALLSITG